MNKRLLIATIALIITVVCAGCSVSQGAPKTYVPKVNGNGSESSVVNPSVNGDGETAEVVSPSVNGTGGGTTDKEPFVPDIIDKDPFVSMGDDYDFSKQYDYTNATLSAGSGSFNVSNGVYTATSANSIQSNLNTSTPFPYGTISANIKNNGGDVGLIIGLSTSSYTFWEGNGISYYFVFINKDGLCYVGKTNNGAWSVVGHVQIQNFNPQTTYNLKVIYRVNKIIC